MGKHKAKRKESSASSAGATHKKQKPLQVSIMDTGPPGNVVATSAGVRIVTGDTPRDNDVELMMVRTDGNTPVEHGDGNEPPTPRSNTGLDESGDDDREEPATGSLNTTTAPTARRSTAS
ncbi:unnamed protein product [Phytophthora lilii]|uniref:Unnamed protein product n=1 Tax=Phytophthora lilii TaxID=2077276 RepID=A0A9W6WW37_9STRA|nr:unnamed protein product [Phytophthora lilii]